VKHNELAQLIRVRIVQLVQPTIVE